MAGTFWIATGPARQTIAALVAAVLALGACSGTTESRLESGAVAAAGPGQTAGAPVWLEARLDYWLCPDWTYRLDVGQAVAHFRPAGLSPSQIETETAITATEYLVTAQAVAVVRITLGDALLAGSVTGQGRGTTYFWTCPGGQAALVAAAEVALADLARRTGHGSIEQPHR